MSVHQMSHGNEKNNNGLMESYTSDSYIYGKVGEQEKPAEETSGPGMASVGDEKEEGPSALYQYRKHRREQIDRCEKDCMQRLKKTYKKIPQCPKCQINCSVSLLTSCPNWLLFFFVHNEPKDLSIEDFKKQDKPGIVEQITRKIDQLDTKVRVRSKEIKENVQNAALACSKQKKRVTAKMDHGKERRKTLNNMNARIDYDDRHKDDVVASKKEKHTKRYSYRQKDSSKSMSQHCNVGLLSQESKTNRLAAESSVARTNQTSPFKKRGGVAIAVHDGGKTKQIENDRFGIVKHLFDENTALTEGKPNRAFFYTTDNKRYFKRMNLLEKHFETRIHTMDSPTVKRKKIPKTPTPKKQLSQVRVFKKTDFVTFRTPPPSHVNFGDISNTSVKKLKFGIGLLDTYSPNNLTVYATTRLGEGKRLFLPGDSDDENEEAVNKRKILALENKRKQQEIERKEQELAEKEAAEALVVKEWVCPSCDYINILEDEECMICSCFRPAESVKELKDIDEDNAANLDLKTYMEPVSLPLFLQSIRCAEKIVGQSFHFSDLHEYCDILGAGLSGTVFHAVTFFEFGEAVSLEDNIDHVDQIADKWDHLRLKIRTRKKAFKMDRQREIENSVIGNNYDDEDDDKEMNMTKEAYEQQKRMERKKKALKKKSHGREQDLVPKQKFWQQFDPSTADVIVLNLTGIWNEIEEQVSIEKYIEAMEVWLSYTKGRSFLILYLRNEQVEKAAGLHILSWTLIDPIISVTGIDMKAFIFRRDFDV